MSVRGFNQQILFNNKEEEGQWGGRGEQKTHPHKINDGLNIMNQGINTIKRKGKAQKGENHVLVSGKDVSSKVLCKHPEGQGTVRCAHCRMQPLPLLPTRKKSTSDVRSRGLWEWLACSWHPGRVKLGQFPPRELLTRSKSNEEERHHFNYLTAQTLKV